MEENIMETSGEFNCLGAKVCLDRLLPKLSGVPQPVYSMEYLYEPCDDVRGFTPYACTFTYPALSDRVLEKKKISAVVNGRLLHDVGFRKLSPSEQLAGMKEDIEAWFYAFKKSMASIAPKNRTIFGYLITFEMTKADIIHAHGLLWVDNAYYTAVSHYMTLAWLKISGGNVSAMSKYRNAFINNAFDKCTNVDKWLEYILKEKPLIRYELLFHYIRNQVTSKMAWMDLNLNIFEPQKKNSSFVNFFSNVHLYAKKYCKKTFVPKKTQAASQKKDYKTFKIIQTKSPEDCSQRSGNKTSVQYSFSNSF